MRPATNRLLKNNSSYEKSNHTWFSAVRCRFDAGLLCQRTRGDYNYNASDYRHNGGPASAFTNDNNNDAHGRRLLIGRSRHFQPVQ
jgi:hypothetical protein